jgi:AhpD family alkylhydroperoxidase
VEIYATSLFSEDALRFVLLGMATGSLTALVALGIVLVYRTSGLVAWAYGDMYNRPELGSRDRQLVTLGMLTALGGCEPQLDFHVNAALNVGLAPEEIVEALLHASVYCGIPKALNATVVAQKVFAERDPLPVAAG